MHFGFPHDDAEQRGFTFVQVYTWLVNYTYKQIMQ